ncbi:MAG: hypothetical protein SFX72_23120 [Isosphaeraceae bacterium]|nr:hypothetical protein [Isosphaeraceae bacterium]
MKTLTRIASALFVATLFVGCEGETPAPAPAGGGSTPAPAPETAKGGKTPKPADAPSNKPID